MPRRDWIDRYPSVKRFLEQPEDVLEGVSAEPPAAPRHVYTLECCAGETLQAGDRVSFDDECAVRWSPGETLIGVALTAAEPGGTVRIEISEIYFTH